MPPKGLSNSNIVGKVVAGGAIAAGVLALLWFRSKSRRKAHDRGRLEAAETNATSPRTARGDVKHAAAPSVARAVVPTAAAAAGAGAGAAETGMPAWRKVVRMTRSSELSDYLDKWALDLKKDPIDERQTHNTFVAAVVSALATPKLNGFDVYDQPAGSWAKHTQIRTKRVDFDTLIVFDAHADEWPWGDAKAAAAPVHVKCNGATCDSSAYVAKLKAAVASASVAAEFKTQNIRITPYSDSVTVHFADFDIDLLPAIRASAKPQALPNYLVPDHRHTTRPDGGAPAVAAEDAGGWRFSATGPDIAMAKFLELQSTIMLVKHLWVVHAPLKISSVVIEWSASLYGEQWDIIADAHWQQMHVNVYRLLSQVHRAVQSGNMPHRFNRGENLLEPSTSVAGNKQKAAGVAKLEKLMLNWRTALQALDVAHVRSILEGDTLRDCDGTHYPVLFVRAHGHRQLRYHFCSESPCPADAVVVGAAGAAAAARSCDGPDFVLNR